MDAYNVILIRCACGEVNIHHTQGERMSNRLVNTIALLAVVAVIVLAAMRIHDRSGSRRTVDVDSGRFIIMGTIGRIQVRAKSQSDGDDAIRRAKAALDKVDRLMSTYRDDSELSKVNRLAGTQAVGISQETHLVLQRAQHYSSITDGAFDITVTPLLDVWKRAGRADRLPTQDELAEAAAHVGFKYLTLSTAPPYTVKFLKDKMALTVDAIAKGYAVDCALTAIRSVASVEAALVDVGGEIACFGRDWIIGIQDPFDAGDQLSEKPRWRIRVRDGGVASSGNYRRYVTIAGRQYSHIIDPRTGRPADKLPSVTVIAKTVMDADALATAVSVLGTEKGLALIETLADTEAMVVTDKPVQIHRSSGFSQYEFTR